MAYNNNNNNNKSKIQNPKLGILKESDCLIIPEDHNMLEVEALQSLEPQILLACMASDLFGGWLFSVSVHVS